MPVTWVTTTAFLDHFDLAELDDLPRLDELAAADLFQVADAAAGCGYVEALSDALAHDAWAKFQVIEAAGGLARALESGLVAGQVAAAREALAADLVEGRRKLLGVTDFRSGDDTPPEVGTRVTVSAPEVRLPGPDGVCPPLTSWRLEEALA